MTNGPKREQIACFAGNFQIFQVDLFEMLGDKVLRFDKSQGIVYTKDAIYHYFGPHTSERKARSVSWDRMLDLHKGYLVLLGTRYLIKIRIAQKGTDNA